MAYDGMLSAEEQREVVQKWDKRVSTATRSKKNPKEDGAAHEPLASETMSIQERPAAGCFFLSSYILKCGDDSVGSF